MNDSFSFVIIRISFDFKNLKTMKILFLIRKKRIIKKQKKIFECLGLVLGMGMGVLFHWVMGFGFGPTPGTQTQYTFFWGEISDCSIYIFYLTLFYKL